MKLAIHILRFVFAYVFIAAIANVLVFAVFSISGVYENYSGNLRVYSFVPRVFLGSFVYLAGISATYAAIVDLNSIDERTMERFRIRSLGWLGICGLALFLIVLIQMLEAITQIYSLIQFGGSVLNSSLFLLAATLDYSLPTLLVGGLCFYLRYRIAANRRLAAVHEP